MQHPDPDDLALIALGEGIGDTVDAHVAGCAQCSAEVESFRLTVGLADLSNFGEDAASPGEHVWESIATELGFAERRRPGSGVATAFGDNPGNGLPSQPMPPSDVGSAHAQDDRLDRGALDHQASNDVSSTPGAAQTLDRGAAGAPGLRAVPGTGTPSPPATSGSDARRWPRWATPLAAAVIGVAVGAGAVVITQNRADEVTVEATAPLTPVPGGPLATDQKEQLGKAEIVAAANGQQVRVQAADLPATTNDYEVWLFGNDGKMVSLGTLDNGAGTFTVPQGISTQEYRVIDVSDEPPDGVPTHSGVSLIRGRFS